jgi:ABC-2 type transport system ATP-binding protein
VNGPVFASNLTKYFGTAAVLDGVSLDVPEGSVFGLVGPNGAGKTTTIKILMNILSPTAGRAEVLGVDSRRLGPAEFARIGYVSENQEMPEWMTVEQLLAYLKPFCPSWDDKHAAGLVARFELPPRRKLGHLSRGMWMKTALASSLAYRPRVLILDEVFSGLDPLVRDDLIEGTLDHAGETTVLISSHDLAEIESIASHICYLDRGRVQFSEEMESLMSRFREVEVTLEPPANPVSLEQWPSHWLRPEATPALVRFIETRFDEEHTTSAIRQMFGGVRHVSANPMPLRAIFVAVARNRSKTPEVK